MVNTLTLNECVSFSTRREKKCAPVKSNDFVFVAHFVSDFFSVHFFSLLNIRCLRISCAHCPISIFVMSFNRHDSSFSGEFSLVWLSVWLSRCARASAQATPYCFGVQPNIRLPARMEHVIRSFSRSADFMKPMLFFLHLINKTTSQAVKKAANFSKQFVNHTRNCYYDLDPYDTIFRVCCCLCYRSIDLFRSFARQPACLPNIEWYSQNS